MKRFPSQGFCERSSGTRFPALLWAEPVAAGLNFWGSGSAVTLSLFLYCKLYALSSRGWSAGRYPEIRNAGTGALGGSKSNYTRDIGHLPHSGLRRGRGSLFLSEDAADLSPHGAGFCGVAELLPGRGEVRIDGSIIGFEVAAHLEVIDGVARPVFHEIDFSESDLGRGVVGAFPGRFLEGTLRLGKLGLARRGALVEENGAQERQEPVVTLAGQEGLVQDLIGGGEIVFVEIFLHEGEEADVVLRSELGSAIELRLALFESAEACQKDSTLIVQARGIGQIAETAVDYLETERVVLMIGGGIRHVGVETLVAGRGCRGVKKSLIGQAGLAVSEIRLGEEIVHGDRPCGRIPERQKDRDGLLVLQGSQITDAEVDADGIRIETRMLRGEQMRNRSLQIALARESGSGMQILLRVRDGRRWFLGRRCHRRRSVLLSGDLRGSGRNCKRDRQRKAEPCRCA